LSTPHHQGNTYDHLIAQRWLLLWVHITAAAVLAAIYLKLTPFGRVPFCVRLCGVIVIVRASVVIVPYVISGIFSRRLISPRRIPAALFAAVLALGAVVQGIVITEAQPEDRLLLALVVSFVEILVFVFAARVLFGATWGSNNRWRGP
jgi:hypothetical protein